MVEALSGKDISIVGSNVTIGAAPGAGLKVVEQDQSVAISATGGKLLGLSGVGAFSCQSLTTNANASVAGNLHVTGDTQIDGVTSLNGFLNCGIVHATQKVTLQDDAAVWGTLYVKRGGAEVNIDTLYASKIEYEASAAATASALTALTDALAAAVARIADIESLLA
jgi:hypothetical protein